MHNGPAAVVNDSKVITTAAARVSVCVCDGESGGKRERKRERGIERVGKCVKEHSGISIYL